MEVMMEEVKMEISNQEVSGCLVGLGKQLKNFDFFFLLLFFCSSKAKSQNLCILKKVFLCVFVGLYHNNTAKGIIV